MYDFYFDFATPKSLDLDIKRNFYGYFTFKKRGDSTG